MLKVTTRCFVEIEIVRYNIRVRVSTKSVLFRVISIRYSPNLNERKIKYIYL